MDQQLMVRRSEYALDTVWSACKLSIDQFFPLLGAWAACTAVPVFVTMVAVMIGGFIDHGMGFKHGGYATLAALLLGIGMLGTLFAGWIATTLRVARGQPCKMSDLIRSPAQIWAAFVVYVITTTLVGLGMMLLIPGALLFLKWQLAPFYVVDRGYGPIQALRQSWQDTGRVFVPLAILDLVFWGIHLLGGAGSALSFGLTLIIPVIANMVLAVASALVYARWMVDENNPEFLKDKILIEEKP